MIAIKEDDRLGVGQETEKKMAENMHVDRMEINAGHRLEKRLLAALRSHNLLQD